MNSYKSVGISKIWSFVDLIQEFKVSSISSHIIHGFDVAKISTVLYKKIFGDGNDIYMYLSGLLHDVGLVVYASISAPGSMGLVIKEAEIDGNISFDIEKFLERFDKDEAHPKITFTILKRLNILPKKFLKALLYHHTPLSKIDGTDEEVTLANIISVADRTSRSVRRSMRWGIENVPKALKEVSDSAEMLPEVRIAYRELMADAVTLRYCFDDKPYKEIFMNKDMEIGLDQLVELLKMLVLFIDLRSPFTLRHSSAIAALSRDIAVEMFGSEFDGLLMYMAGLVHDIGKIRTPLYILHKPDKLDADESYIMKLHVVDTFKMLDSHKELIEIAAVASLHHERLDGSGYPWGYSGKDLSLRSRILQVADVFEALLEDRPYRKAHSEEEAIGIIENEVRHGKLDANVLNTLKTMLKNGYRIEKEELVIFQFFEELKDIEQIRYLLKT